MPDTDQTRLFGRPGAEHLHFDLAAAYEHDVEPWFDRDSDRPCVIEEWTVRPPVEHLPPVDGPLGLLDWACEWVGENGEMDEDGSVAFSDAAESDDVKAAFRAALDLWASKVRYRMAHEHLRDHVVTWDAEGEPLVNGERLYQPAEQRVPDLMQALTDSLEQAKAARDRKLARDAEAQP